MSTTHNYRSGKSISIFINLIHLNTVIKGSIYSMQVTCKIILSAKIEFANLQHLKKQ